jgi:5,5'-dehydrodivanillate O-demethylase oxygenase subunit
MLTQRENERLTRVGPGTPAGELLRRYWHVVSAAVELTEENPVKPVKILGEDLVVFRMPPGPGETEPNYGLVGERCPHRSAALKYGLVDCEGIRCIYHGWKFSPSGACLEQPAEAPESTFKERVRQQAYPVQKLAGLLFAYMGPLPAPLLPRWDVLVREDGFRWGVIESVVDCNWLQAMENSVDPSHLYWLHGSLGTQNFPTGSQRYAALGLPDQYGETHEFTVFEYGIQKRRITPGKTPDAPPLDEQHPLVFPTSLRLVVSLASVKQQRYEAARLITAEEEQLGYAHSMQFRTPIDDEHIMHYMVNFLPSQTRTTAATEDPRFERAPFKDADGKHRLDYVTAQDALAWESQGPIVDRGVEHLAASDRGIVLLRKVVREQIDVVQNGGDPLGVIRDPERNSNIDLDIVHEPFGIYRAQALA